MLRGSPQLLPRWLTAAPRCQLSSAARRSSSSIVFNVWLAFCDVLWVIPTPTIKMAVKFSFQNLSFCWKEMALWWICRQQYYRVYKAAKPQGNISLTAVTENEFKYTRNESVTLSQLKLRPVDRRCSYFGHARGFIELWWRSCEIRKRKHTCCTSKE